MAYFAKIENSLVVQVIVADAVFVSNLNGTWVETFGTDFGGPDRNLADASQNAITKRGHYASVGFFYDSEKDQFSPPTTEAPQVETDPTVLAASSQTNVNGGVQ